MHTLPKFVRLTAMSSVIAIGLAAVPATAAPVITAVNTDLNGGPFSFSYLGGTFTFAAGSGFPNLFAVKTAGGAAVRTSFFGGPSVDFVNRGTVVYDANILGGYAEMPVLTDARFSNNDSFLGLRVTSNGQNYYGFAYTTNSVLNSYGFETSPDTGITATTAIPAAVPEPATWAMMLVGFGAVGFALRRRKSERGAVPLAA